MQGSSDLGLDIRSNAGPTGGLLGIFSSVSEILERAASRQGSERRGHERFNSFGTLELSSGSSRQPARLIDLSYGGLLCEVGEIANMDDFSAPANQSILKVQLAFFDLNFSLAAVPARFIDGKLALIFQHQDASALADLRYVIEPLRIGRELAPQPVKLTKTEQLEVKFLGSNHTQVVIHSRASPAELSAKLQFLDGGHAFEVDIQDSNSTITHVVIDNSKGSEISISNAYAVGLRVAYFVLRGIHCPEYSLKIHAICERLERQLASVSNAHSSNLNAA